MTHRTVVQSNPKKRIDKWWSIWQKKNVMITICHWKSFIQIKRGDECSITACAPYFKVSTLFTDSIIKLRILPYCLILPSHHPPAYTNLYFMLIHNWTTNFKPKFLNEHWNQFCRCIFLCWGQRYYKSHFLNSSYNILLL